MTSTALKLAQSIQPKRSIILRVSKSLLTKSWASVQLKINVRFNLTSIKILQFYQDGPCICKPFLQSLCWVSQHFITTFRAWLLSTCISWEDSTWPAFVSWSWAQQPLPSTTCLCAMNRNSSGTFTWAKFTLVASGLYTTRSSHRKKTSKTLGFSQLRTSSLDCHAFLASCTSFLCLIKSMSMTHTSGSTSLVAHHTSSVR